MFMDQPEGRRLPRPLLVFVLVTLAVGALGSIATEPAIPTWYALLAKPGFNPPNWVFAPVWTTLYIMMGMAAWRVWRVTGARSAEIVLFAVQLAFNLAWSWIFFSWHLLLPALVEMAVLALLVAATLIAFWRRDRIAGVLMLPYLAWLGFAFALNLAIWRLNG
jgi:tryptophan-rich sensory protein